MRLDGVSQQRSYLIQIHERNRTALKDLLHVLEAKRSLLNPFEQVCAMGFWRAPCNVDFLGRCIACTKSINGTITKAAEPYTEDKCEWQCSVGFWQFDKTVCTQGDRLCNKCKPCTRKVIKNSAEKFIFVISVCLIHFLFFFCEVATKRGF